MKKIYVGLFVLFCCLTITPTFLIAKPSSVTSKLTTIPVADLPDRKNIKFIVIDAAMTYPDLQHAIKEAYGKEAKTTYITSSSYTQPTKFDAEGWEHGVARYNMNYDKNAQLYVEF